MNKNKNTTKPIRPASAVEADPEFVRVPDVQRRSGIRRGICYRKINDGTFKSVVLREPGKQKGVRLVFWPSVKSYLHKLMAEADATHAAAVVIADDNGKVLA